jgi:EAL domain-containing protein (putative c-di-GMP-specific phosphodiesterase class I)
MYRAKAAGRDCYRMFTEAMDADVQRRDQIEAGLRIELENGTGPNLHFQPVIDASGELVGFEGLMRWTHSALGPVSPAELIPIAEESGLMDELGRRVLAHACAVARRWPDLRIAVNVSPTQFRTSDFAGELKRLVESHGVRCTQIELEITEALFINDAGMCQPAIEQLRAAGFRVCLDDFGTGYSSLNCLRRFGIDKIKLDRSFIDAASRDQSIAMVRAAVTLGHAMDLEVVAEGIASEEEEQIALEAGCDGVQGYFYAHPMPLEQLDAFLATWQRGRIRSAA